MHRLKKAVERHLRRTTHGWTRRLRDPRDRQGQRWAFAHLLNAFWAGVLCAIDNLRGVESLTERMGHRVPDTTLNNLLLRLSPSQFERLIVAEVREAQRAKEIQPTMPFSVVAIDGKAIWSGDYKANRRLIDAAKRGYVIALKNPQKELVNEAKRLLESRVQPDAETDWERTNGVRIRRRLFRSTEIGGYNGWKHLREVWLVRQETESSDGNVTVEDRYFVTNLPPGRTHGKRPLAIVRAHWGIENHANWTMDVVWKEDQCPWAAAAALVVSLMRLLAFNVVMRLRARHLRSEENRRRPWRNLIDLVTDVVLGRSLRTGSLFGANERELAVLG